MNTPSPEPSPEDQKLTLELNKLVWIKRSFYVDLVAKIALPAAVFALAWATYATSTAAVEDRMAFDTNTKAVELRQKQDELFLKQSDSVRSRESLKAGFIQNNFALILSTSPDARKQVETLARVVFSAGDIDDVLLKMAQVRESAPRTVEVVGTPAPSAASYKASGLQFVNAGNFSQALQHFETATLLNPSDAQAWNFRAYSEMRVGSSEAALKSIGTSILLRPSDPTLQHWTLINATKILCSLGRNGDAASYMTKGISTFPELSAIARKDKELGDRCNFIWPNER